FRRDGLACAPGCKPAGFAIVRNEDRVIHRQIVRELLKIAIYLIAPGSHSAMQQICGFCQRRFWIVDETLLRATPARLKISNLFRTKRVNLELVHALGAMVQFSFCRSISSFSSQVVVLRSESVAQCLSSAETETQVNCGRYGDDKQDEENPDNWCHV